MPVLRIVFQFSVDIQQSLFIKTALGQTGLSGRSLTFCAQHPGILSNLDQPVDNFSDIW